MRVSAKWRDSRRWVFLPQMSTSAPWQRECARGPTRTATTPPGATCACAPRASRTPRAHACARSQPGTVSVAASLHAPQEGPQIRGAQADAHTARFPAVVTAASGDRVLEEQPAQTGGRELGSQSGQQPGSHLMPQRRADVAGAEDSMSPARASWAASVAPVCRVPS